MTSTGNLKEKEKFQMSQSLVTPDNRNFLSVIKIKLTIKSQVENPFFLNH
jgi:hypothetical protein